MCQYIQCITQRQNIIIYEEAHIEERFFAQWGSIPLDYS